MRLALCTPCIMLQRIPTKRAERYVMHTQIHTRKKDLAENSGITKMKKTNGKIPDECLTRSCLYYVYGDTDAFETK